MKKKVFIDKYKHENMIENQQKFLKIMQDYTLYIVDFNIDGFIKEKKYPKDYIVGKST